MASNADPFCDFDIAPEMIRTVIVVDVNHPPSLRSIEDPTAGRDIDRPRD